MSDAEAAPATPASVFVSYARQDHDRVARVVDRLRASGIDVWVDQERILGGMNYGEQVVAAIRDASAFLLMCSDASLRSREVKQEIQLAWRYRRRMLPLLLERVSFPEQVEYWTTGWQWIEILNQSEDTWLPRIRGALADIVPGAAPTTLGGADGAGTSANPRPIAGGLDGLRSIAAFTDQIWPVVAGPADGAAPLTRGLGAPQTGVQHGHHLGSRVRLAIETDRAGHLLLLDEGPERILYCLCPSWFAPDTRLPMGRSFLPQPGARYDAFLVTGEPGREQLLAIITDEPLPFNWKTPDPGTPARILGKDDVDRLLDYLRRVDADKWTALSTYFDIVA